MKLKTIRARYLEQFAKNWDAVGVEAELRRLLKQARDAGSGAMANIIAAHLMARRGKPDRAITRLASLSGDDSLDAIAALLKARILCVAKNDPKTALARYDEAIVTAGRLELHPEGSMIVALQYFGRGVALGMLARHDEAVGSYDKVVTRIGEATGPSFRVLLASALLNKGVMFGKMGRWDDQLNAYQEVLERFKNAREPGLRVAVAHAFCNKAIVFGQMGRPFDQLSCYEEVIERFGNAQDLGLREQVGRALFNKGFVLDGMKRYDEALNFYDEVVRRFGGAAEPGLRARAARALFHKSLAVVGTDREGEAEGFLDQIVTRFGDAAEVSLRETVADALVWKALLFARDRDEDDKRLATLREFERRFDDMKGETGAWASRFSLAYALRAQIEGVDDGARRRAADAAKGKLAEILRVYLTSVGRYIDERKKKEYFNRMDHAKARTDRFLFEESRFDQHGSFLLVLREWNSYTPALPAEGEADRGGGYFVRSCGQGIVIDPGYDFIHHFHRVGGRLSDIDHIILTHAHDDHTAEFEALLTLLHQHNREKEASQHRRVGLYLSVGAQRKFSGLLDFRDPRFKRVVTLSPARRETSQRIELNSGTVLTVLPAYHDDVITKDLTVGLGLEFKCAGDETRRVVFTSDTCLYPRLEIAGQLQYYDKERKTPKLDTREGNAVYEQYPVEFREHPDLLVAHIGSIVKQEFEPFDVGSSTPEKHKEIGEWLYTNHLGILGTLILLDQVRPKVAFISEFGAELKGFHIELVNNIALALSERQDDSQVPPEQRTVVFPGDLTMCFDIEGRKLLCHDDCSFRDPAELLCRGDRNYTPKLDAPAKHIDAKPDKSRQRAYLFRRERDENEDQVALDAQNSKQFFESYFNSRLPFHRKR